MIELQRIMDQKESPQNVIERLVNAKKKKIKQSLLTAQSMQKAIGQAIDLDYNYISTPINPLLLCTAVAISIVEKEDHKSLLSSYSDGFINPLFEKKVLTLYLEDFGHHKLNEIMAIEDKYIKGLIELSKNHLKENGFMSLLLSQDKIMTSWHLYLLAWKIINPLLDLKFIFDLATDEDFSEEFRSYLIKQLKLDDFIFSEERTLLIYNNIGNDIIHNSINYYKHQINEYSIELNKKLISGEKIEKTSNELNTLHKLNNRSYRLYQWIPGEISAYSAETQNALTKSNKNSEVYVKYKKYII